MSRAHVLKTEATAALASLCSAEDISRREERGERREERGERRCVLSVLSG
jgi:hypothetical protein